VATTLGSDKDDVLPGYNPGDVLIGGQGNDRYDIYMPRVQIREAADGGIDAVVTALASYTLPANVENLYFTGSAAATLTGNAAANEIQGGAGNDKLGGGAGNDTMWGEAGNDALDGGDGADALVGGTGNDKLDGGAGDDALWGEADNDTLAGGEGADDLSGDAGNDRLDGGNGDDTLWGNDGDDTLVGGAGDDHLFSHAGSAVVQGGAGNDWLWIPGALQDYLRERTGAASVRLTSTVTGAVIEATDVEFIAADEGGYSLDRVTGVSSQWNDRLYSMASGTTLDAGNGDDTYVVRHDGVIIAEAAKGGRDTVETDRSHVLGANIENLVLTGTGNIHGTGNALANALTGNAGANVLDGGAGKDTMTGGDGGDRYIVDDEGDVIGEKAGDTGNDIVYSMLASYTLGDGLEDLAAFQGRTISGTAGFTGIGNAAGNRLQGALGNDRLSGNDGNDVLAGRAGDDSLAGGSGDDILYPDSGTDTVDGGTGTDTLVLYGALADYTRVGVSATDLLLTRKSTAESVLVRNVESFLFASERHTLAEVMLDIGTPGNDTIASIQAADVLAGGAGNDVYVVGHESVAITEAAKGGTDTVRASVDFTLGDNVEKLELTGAAANGWGNALNNTITGNAADNYLDGGAGADTLSGGDGDDSYFVDNAGDKVIDTSGYDAVYTALASYRLGAGIEGLSYGGTVNFTGTGNELDNDIWGGKGNDKLLGGAGNDWLNGWGGADSLTGGAGSDSFFVWLDQPDLIADFKSGVDRIVFNLHGQVIGNGDMVIDSGEIVIVSANARSLNAAGAAAVIGTAQEVYAEGETKLFVVDNGAATAVFRFTSSGADAVVSAGELALVATLTGVKETALADFSFGEAYDT
jgi:Ca2+-binding RTX toxin-like protein